MQEFIKRFSETGLEDRAETGNKAAIISHLYNMRSTTGIAIPAGFIITASAYRYFIKYNGFEEQLSHFLKNLDPENNVSIAETAATCRKLISNGKIPLELELALTHAYESYLPYEQDVAVRNSVNYDSTADTPLHDTYLNIQGSIALMYALKCCYASLYNDDAVRYRAQNGISQTNIHMAVIVQKMVRADLACSGNAFVQTNENRKNIRIDGSWGLGHHEPSEGFCPDAYHLSKPLSSIVYQPVKKTMGNKMRMLVYNQNAAGTHTTDLRLTPAEFRDQFVLNDSEIDIISSWASALEDILGYSVHFKWAKDGYTNNLFLLEATPS